MKLEEFIQRKLVCQKNFNFNFQKDIKRWYVLIDFQVPKNCKAMTGYLNKCFVDKKISMLQDRELIFAKTYIFGMKMKMKLWVETSVVCEPIFATLNAVIDGI